MSEYWDTPEDEDRRARLKASVDPSSQDHALMREVIQSSNDEKHQEAFTSYLAKHTLEILRQHHNAAAAHRRLVRLEQKGFLNWLRYLPWRGAIAHGVIVAVVAAGILTLVSWAWPALLAFLASKPEL